MNFLEILHEDEDVIVLNKPSDLVCHPTKTDCLSSLIARLRLFQKICPLRQNPRNCPYAESEVCPYSVETGKDAENPPYISLVNRLDRETSGIILAAKNKQAVRELGSIFANCQAQKTYLAIVVGIPDPLQGEIVKPLGKDLQSKVVIKDCVREDGHYAKTDYKFLKSLKFDGITCSLLEIYPKTGRKHQIRIHLASMGHPILGDKLYGSDENYYLEFVEHRLSDARRRELILQNHALHAFRIQFSWRDKRWDFKAPWYFTDNKGKKYEIDILKRTS